MKKSKRIVLTPPLIIYMIGLMGVGIITWILGVFKYFIEVFIALGLTNTLCMAMFFIRKDHENDYE
ncbi:hypothetical protein [Lactobacillus sp.]|uniref:hypothetical protein n=1 Tax=Lactobacillus sp. TaxID=1591 RepID=UPI001990916E|nr:hypothetical protein [Lactobacillus sp.]MBD5430499.1 hypothetical protein [Lactobacillus sp.]